MGYVKEKIYINIGDTAGVDVIFVPEGYHASATGLKHAREDGCTEHTKFFQVDNEKIMVMPIERVVGINGKDRRIHDG